MWKTIHGIAKKWYSVRIMAIEQVASSTEVVLQNVNQYIAGVNFAEPTWDLFLILFFIIASFIYGLTLGRERIIVILVSLYMTIAVIAAAPFINQIAPAQYGPNNVFAFHLAVFLLIFVLIFFLLSRNTLLRTLTRSEAPGQWWQVIIFSVLHVGLLISIVLSFVPSEYQTYISPALRNWFIGEQATFFWVIAPIVAMAFSKMRTDSDD